MPFTVPKLKLEVFMNGIYKDILMEDIAKCTNLPTFEGEWDEVLEGTYNFNMCKLGFESFPESLLPGFYKVVVEAFDDKDNMISSLGVILEIELMKD